MDHTYAVAIHMRAYIYVNKRNYEKAKVLYKKEIQISQYRTDPHIELGYIANQGK